MAWFDGTFDCVKEEPEKSHIFKQHLQKPPALQKSECSV